MSKCHIIGNHTSQPIYDLSIDNVKTYLPVIDVVILLINTVKQNTTFKTVERLHQNQGQFSCHYVWYKVRFMFYNEY